MSNIFTVAQRGSYNQLSYQREIRRARRGDAFDLTWRRSSELEVARSNSALGVICHQFLFS